MPAVVLCLQLASVQQKAKYFKKEEGGEKRCRERRLPCKGAELGPGPACSGGMQRAWLWTSASSCGLDGLMDLQNTPHEDASGAQLLIGTLCAVDHQLGEADTSWANPGKHNAGADSPVGVTTTVLGGWRLGANLPVGLGSSKLAFVLQIHHVMDLLTMS
ncbi:hypothetical protein Anapl_14763 [Anas platyrhynchos]|uniref:Uncharacterized protein n=1 Tax=Anas platyrhynchos TaxID=8839 RepID=R0KZV1_ANAPL|nr:hypothetical protein Anapl_14763 [Anas platyrhynchos]